MGTGWVTRRLVALLAVALALTAVGCSTDAPGINGPMPTLSTRGSQDTPSPSVTASTSSAALPLYLALGDSLTAGFQNAKRDDKARAYPALVTRSRAQHGVQWDLVNLACSGETTSSMIRGGRCFPAPDAQLTQAESTLRGHVGNVALVTVWIGANDVLGCVRSGTVDRSCSSAAGDTYAVNLRDILGRLRQAAGPDVPILVVDYYDAFRRTVAGRTPDPAFQAASAVAVDELNAAIRSAAQATGARTVDARGPVEGVDGSDLCVRTLVCDRGDIHLTDEGQVVMQHQVLDALGR